MDFCVPTKAGRRITENIHTANVFINREIVVMDYSIYLYIYNVQCSILLLDLFILQDTQLHFQLIVNIKKELN